MKTFKLNKKYTKNEEKKGRNEKGGKFYSMYTFAKKTNKFDDPKKLETVKSSEKLIYEKRLVTYQIKIDSSTIEVLIPTNIYSKNSLALKMTAKF